MTDVNALLCLNYRESVNGGLDIHGTFNLIRPKKLPFLNDIICVVAWIGFGEILPEDSTVVTLQFLDPEGQPMYPEVEFPVDPTHGIGRIAMTIQYRYVYTQIAMAGPHPIRILVNGILAKEIYLRVELNTDSA